MAPSVTGIEDHGTYWIVTYDDGGYDNVPKDPAILDTAAANASAIGQTALGAKLAAFAAHIRKDGKPVDLPMSTGSLVLLFGGGLVAAYFLFRKML